MGCAVRQIELHTNSQSRTQFGNDPQVIASTPDAEAARSITSRPVFATVERVVVDRTYYLLMTQIDSTTLQAASHGIRSLLSAWDLRNILHFLYPLWYSGDEGSRQSIANVPEFGANCGTDDGTSGGMSISTESGLRASLTPLHRCRMYVESGSHFLNVPSCMHRIRHVCHSLTYGVPNLVRF